MSDSDDSADAHPRVAPDPQLLRWLADRVGGRGGDLQLESMVGATSSQVTRVVGGSKPAVLRQFTNAEWLAREPDLAQHEAGALRAAQQTGLPVPELLGVYAPDGSTPAVLMTLLPGRVWIPMAPDRTWIDHLAVSLARIHAVVPADLDWRYRTWTRADQLTVPQWTSAPAAWRRAIERFRQGPPPASSVLVHRDYHPANLLWRDGAPAGVVDWVNACLGPAGIDIAHCSLNLACMYGLDVVAAFRDSYERARPGYVQPGYWEIEVVLGALPTPSFYAPWVDFGLPYIEVEQLCRRLEDLLLDALARA